MKCNSDDLSFERTDATFHPIQSELVPVSLVRSQVNIIHPDVLCGAPLFILLALRDVYDHFNICCTRVQSERRPCYSRQRFSVMRSDEHPSVANLVDHRESADERLQ